INFIDLLRKAKLLETHCAEMEQYRYNFSQDIKINDNVSVVLEIEEYESVKTKILEGLSVSAEITWSLFRVVLNLSQGKIRIKDFPDNSAENLKKKVSTK